MKRFMPGIGIRRGIHLLFLGILLVGSLDSPASSRAAPSVQSDGMQIPLSGSAEQVGQVVGGPHTLDGMDAAPLPARAAVADGRISGWETRYGTRAGQQFLAPQSPPDSLSPQGPAVDLGGWRTFDRGGANSIAAIQIAPDGRLFVAVSGVGLWVYAPDAAGNYSWSTITPSAGGLVSSGITSLAISGNLLWIGTSSSGISELNLTSSAWKTYSTANSSLPSNAINHISGYADPNYQEFYASTTAGTWHYVLDGYGTSSTFTYFLNKNVYDTLLQNGNGFTYLWFGLDYSIQIYDITKNLWGSYTNPAGCPMMGGADRLALDGQGGVWFGAIAIGPAAPSKKPNLSTTPKQPAATFFYGACRFYGGGFTKFDDITPGLPSDWITDMSTDEAGRVWMTFRDYNNRYGGAAVFDQGTWLIFQKVQGDPLATNLLSAVAASGESAWFGYSDQASVSQFSPNWARYTQAQMNTPGPITAITVDPIQVFLGAGTSLGKISGTNIPTFNLYPIPGNASPITRIVQGASLWIATAGSGLFGWDGATFTPYNQAGGLPSNDVRDLAVDRQSRLWVATSAGLALRADGYWLNFTSANSGLGSNDLTALAVDNRNRLWIGTRDSGIYIMDAQAENVNAWSHYRQADGLPNDIITGLAVEPSGAVWATSTAGAARWDPASSAWTRTGYGNFQKVTSDPSGRIWLVFANGLWYYSGGNWRLYYAVYSLLDSNGLTAIASDGARLWTASGSSLAARGEISGPIGFYPPVISSFTPAQGGVDSLVTLNGSAFDDANPLRNTVAFGGLTEPNTVGDVTAATTTQLQVRVPLLARSGKIWVRAHRLNAVSATDFTITPAIRSLSNTCMALGDVLRIEGSGFNSVGSSGVMVQIGSGPWRNADAQDPAQVRQYVRPGDTDGTVKVRIGQAGPVATSAQSLLVDQPVIDQVAIQQAIQGLPIIWAKRTLVQLSLKSQRGLCITHVGTGLLEFKLKNGTLEQDAYPDLPAAGWSVYKAPPSMNLANTVNFVAWRNAVSLPDFGLDQFDGVRLHAYNGPVELFTYDIPASSFNYQVTLPRRMLSVIVYPNSNPSNANLQAFLDNANKGLAQVARVYPQQDLAPSFGPNLWQAWAWRTIGLDGTIDLGDDDTFHDIQGKVDDILSGRDGFQQATGVIDAALQKPGTNVVGKATSSCTNPFGDCNRNSTVAINLAGDLAHTYLQEATHTYGWVAVGAPNHDPNNKTHSRYNTLTNGACTPSLTFRQAMIDEMGFAGRVVRLDWDKAPYQFSLTGCGVNDQPRSVMSYSPNTQEDNTFYEPSDYLAVLASLRAFLGPAAKAAGQEPALNGLRSTFSFSGPLASAAGQELVLNGLIRADLSAANPVTVTLSYLDAAGGQLTPPSPVGPYHLALLNTAGQPLSDLPFDVSVPESHDSPGAPVKAVGFHLRLAFPSGVARLEMRRAAALLWSKNVSSNPPVVSLVTPDGGAYADGQVIPASWTASDSDGNALTFTLQYSPDGLAWQEVAGGLSGTSYSWLPGFVPDSAQARLRLIASDGFNTAHADSTPFSLAPRPPVAVIRAPQPGQNIMEGQWLEMAGSSLTSAGPDLGSFVWLQDGQTIAGQQIDYQASGGVGDHTLTLQVTYAGLTSNTSLTYHVLPDYAHDGIPNSWKQAYRMNPLDRTVPMTDTDKDGLTTLQEFQLGTDPTKADTDGDGFTDGQELAAGTSPNDPAQFPPSTPTLIVGTDEIGFRLRIGDPAPAPYTVTVSNAGPGPLSWTAVANQPWLQVTASGAASGPLVISADPVGLAPGFYSGQINVAAAGASGSPRPVPVSLAVYNRDGILTVHIYMPVVGRN